MKYFIDPGTKKKHALAMFDCSDRLTGVELIGDGRQLWGPVTIEMPAESWGVVGDMINLARAAERAVAWCTVNGEPVNYVAPGDWKSGRKVVHQYHGWCALTPAEQNSFAQDLKYRGAPNTPKMITEILEARCKKYVTKKPPQFTLGDLIDAAVLGLFCLGRVDKLGRRTGR